MSADQQDKTQDSIGLRALQAARDIVAEDEGMAGAGYEFSWIEHAMVARALLASADRERKYREALEACAESLAFARDKLGMCGEGDGADRKADAPDDIGSLHALQLARAALFQEETT